VTPEPTTSLDFYGGLSAVERLSEWVRDDLYQPVPDDWSVFVTDIEGSTRAIEAGRYKEVNALGASTIIAAANAVGSDAIPFVFGGDGATLVLPPAAIPAVGAALAALGRRAGDTTGLGLRIGRVGVAALRAQGADLRMVKRMLPAGFSLPLFAGGGLSLADRMVKAQPQRYQVPDAEPQPLAMDGLECRWNDVPTTHGTIVSVLVQPANDDLSRLAPLIALLGSWSTDTAPVRRDNLPITFPPRHLRTELAYRIGNPIARGLRHAGIWSLTALFARILAKQSQDTATTAGRYVASLCVNTDHLKLDDTFRAVLDLSQSQADELEALLDGLQRAGEVAYGMHRSDHALMTCFVRSLERHVHFVDGGDGGYAMAARQLKAVSRAASHEH
jgi:hypothetical protein